MFGMHAGSILYSILYSAFGGTSIVGFFISAYLLKYIGSEVFFFISSAMTAVSLVLLYYFNSNPILKKDIEADDDDEDDEKEVMFTNPEDYYKTNEK
jgi:hypothetical protein